MNERYIGVNELFRQLTECWHTNDTEKGKVIQAVIERVVTPIVVGIPEMICRCKCCKHSNEDGTICRYGVGRTVEPEHFCGYGTPKEREN